MLSTLIIYEDVLHYKRLVYSIVGEPDLVETSGETNGFGYIGCYFIMNISYLYLLL